MRDELVKNIQEETEAIESIMASTSDTTKDLVHSSSREARAWREVPSSDLTPREYLAARQEVVDRLKENYEKVLQELEALKALMAREEA